MHALIDPAKGDGVTQVRPVLSRMPDIAAILSSGESEEVSNNLRRAGSAGRPVGAKAFLDRVEAVTGRDPKPAKRGRKEGN